MAQQAGVGMRDVIMPAQNHLKLQKGAAAGNGQ
jgi:hypothetical protein